MHRLIKTKIRGRHFLNLKKNIIIGDPSYIIFENSKKNPLLNFFKIYQENGLYFINHLYWDQINQICYFYII